ncbi:MAG: helix-turn-helix transcriptional regulator [Ruminococcaceae bacterium]|nr:helix-turn-helix transcriptional regulator [Oscillospiraceae bacterium]
MFKGTTDNFDPMRVKMISVEDHCGENEYLSVLSDCFALVLVHAGKISFTINGTANIYGKSTIICLSNRDEKTDIRMYPKSKVSIVYFDTVFLAKGLSMNMLFNNDFKDLAEQHCFFQLKPFMESDAKNKCFVLDSIVYNNFCRLIEEIKKQLKVQPDYFWSCRSRSYLLELLMVMENYLYEFATPDDSGDIEDFKEISEYVCGNLSQNVTLEQLAETFYINSQKIQRLFKKNSGMTYKQYVKEQRFLLAKYFLRFTNLSVDELASKTGYSNVQGFAKFFTQMSGISPIEFRIQQVNARKADSRLYHKK